MRDIPALKNTMKNWILINVRVTTKHKVISLLLSLLPLFLYAQDCDVIDRNIIRKERGIFLLDSVLNPPALNWILSNVRPGDSALVRVIMQNGSPGYDYANL